MIETNEFRVPSSLLSLSCCTLATYADSGAQAGSAGTSCSTGSSTIASTVAPSSSTLPSRNAGSSMIG